MGNILLSVWIVLQSAMLILKVYHIIDSWWLVFIPSYIGIVAVSVLFGLFCYAMSNLH
jgi:hypothetical protein